MIKVDYSGAAGFFTESGPDYELAEKAHRILAERSGAGADFLGWPDLPKKIRDTELERILAAARKICSRSKILVVIGIGGSYLGARGAIEFLRPFPSEEDTKVLFAGNGLNPDYLNDLIAQIGEQDFDVNVISKSGTTLEPAVSFRIFRGLLQDKYGDQANEHIFATTDARRGVLKSLADANGWESFVVPDDVGGRYSVLSAVGLLPMAVAGIDVRRVIDCAIAEFESLSVMSKDNPAWQYAAARQNLYAGGRKIELLACFDPRFRWMAEWWKQLYGESEGKDGIGIYPASVEFTADLHSMGQYIQEGERILMETVVRFDESLSPFTVPEDEGNADGLNYIAGRDLGEIGHVVENAVMQAHISGGVPCMTITAGRRDEEGFASLVCFFEMACGISGYMSGVNPFNQPGVEAYKKNMFRMLGKPGAV